MLCEKSEIKDLCTKLVCNLESSNLGPVVQIIVSLTTSLRHQLVKYIPTTYAIHHYLFGKMLDGKDSHIFSNKK